MANAITLHVATAPLDEHAKRILTTLLKNGWTRADILYATDQSVLSESDAQHLLTRCAVTAPDLSIRPPLKSFSVPKFGPTAGKDIAFVLNFDLA